MATQVNESKPNKIEDSRILVLRDFFRQYKFTDKEQEDFLSQIKTSCNVFFNDTELNNLQESFSQAKERYEKDHSAYKENLTIGLSGFLGFVVSGGASAIGIWQTVSHMDELRNLIPNATLLGNAVIFEIIIAAALTIWATGWAAMVASDHIETSKKDYLMAEAIKQLTSQGSVLTPQ